MPDDIEARYGSRLALLEDLANALREECADALARMAHIDRVAFRVKSSAAFVAKARDPANDPPYLDPLIEIEDQVAGRVIVFFLNDIDNVEDRLSRSFRTVERVHRKPSRDAEFGYESRHFIYSIPVQLVPHGWIERADVPTTFELQVRTLMMHAYAEPQHDLQYRAPTDLAPETRRELAWIAASTWGADQAYERVRRGRTA
jgi:putative GTP pyrophosphokinase